MPATTGGGASAAAYNETVSGVCEALRAAAEPRIVTAGRLPVMELSWVPHALIGPTAWRSDQIAACLPEREHEYVHRRR